MQDQNQSNAEPQAPTPAKIVDVIAQASPVERSAAPVAAPDPELMNEPAVEPAPVQAPAEAPDESITQPNSKETAKKPVPKKTETALATPAKPKQPSTVPVAAISIAIIMFLALATVALLAFRQGF